MAGSLEWEPHDMDGNLMINLYILYTKSVYESKSVALRNLVLTFNTKDKDGLLNWQSVFKVKLVLKVIPGRKSMVCLH